jgi:hypothetical protein
MWVFATCTTNRTGAWVEKTSNRNGKARLFKTVKLTFFPAPVLPTPPPHLAFQCPPTLDVVPAFMSFALCLGSHFPLACA